MPYSELMVKPMREEVTRLGVQELRTVADVDAALGPGEGTALVFVNSICGCAAGMARPALTLALQHRVRPQHLYTVFAGQDLDAPARAARGPPWWWGAPGRRRGAGAPAPPPAPAPPRPGGGATIRRRPGASR